MCCCHCCDKGDCCNSAASAGHMTYLISIVCALVLSYFELEYCLDQHTALASSECDYGCVDGTCSGLPATFDGATGSAMQVEILHHLLGLVSAWATVKFAFRMLALIGTLQVRCAGLGLYLFPGRARARTRLGGLAAQPSARLCRGAAYVLLQKVSG